MTGKMESITNSQKRMQGWQLLLPALFVCSTMLMQFYAMQEADAQNPQNPFAKKKYNNDNEYVPEIMKQPPDLPYLPPFTGSAPLKYESILCFKRKPESPGYTITFHTKDAPEDVMAFYRSAFKDNKWLPQKGGDTTKIVSGTRQGAMATVTMMKPNLPGYRTQVYIVYKISGKIQ